MSYYPEPENHIRDKVKLVLAFSNHATEKELSNATGIDTSNLCAKRNFLALKGEVQKLNIYQILLV